MCISDWSSDVCSSDLPHAGKGVLLVESDKLLYVQDIDVKAGGSSFEITVTAEWERHDVYVTALVFRGGSAPSKITPARAVGVAWEQMERKARRVAVGLPAPDQMRPEQRMRGTGTGSWADSQVGRGGDRTVGS